MIETEKDFSHAPMGTLEWGRRRGQFSKGRLKPLEKATLVANLVRMSVLEQMDRLRAKAGLLNAYGHDLAGLLPPDTRLVSDSVQFAHETQSIELMHHSWRTYYWGVLLGGYGGLAIDREILFSAAILHDLGLAQDRQTQPSQCCFVVHGAERSKSYLIKNGHDPAKCRKIGDAIGLHLNGYVSRRLHGTEAHLLSRGAMCDVFSLGRHRIDHETATELFRLHPQGDLQNALEIWADHHLPGTRADFLIRLDKKSVATKYEPTVQTATE